MKRLRTVENYAVVLQEAKIYVVSRICVIEKKNRRMVADISTDVLCLYLTSKNI